MTTDIDKLTGYELNVAVAEALGWTRSPRARRGNWWIDDGENVRRIAAGDISPTNCTFDPAHNIAAAWELDGDDYLWDHYDVLPMDRPGYAVRVTVNTPAVDRCEATVYYENKTQKTAAYATARCRAWLKSKQAEATDD